MLNSGEKKFALSATTTKNLTLVLSVLRFTDSDYPYGVFNLFLLYANNFIEKNSCAQQSQ